MKKFTCLLVLAIALCISSVQSAACTATTANHAFLARISAINAATVVDAFTDAAVCGNDSLCCSKAGMQTILGAQVTKVKSAIKNFGDKASTIGAAWSKIANLVNATAITGTTSASAALDASTDADRSGATAAQFKAFSVYTAAQYDTDFTNFKGQATDCLAAYSTLYQKIACDGCLDVAADSIPDRWKSEASGNIVINTASADAWAASCYRVWYFFWKAGWFAQTVGFLNNKKASTYTYTAPAANAVYLQTTDVIIENINTAFATCYPTIGDTCTSVMRANLVKAFGAAFGADSQTIGRSDVTLISSSPASNGRRMLALKASDGTIGVDNTKGFTASAATKVYELSSAVVFTDAEKNAWSSGYVSPSTTSSSSSSKSAKVFIGTILSALFAVAFLN